MSDVLPVGPCDVGHHASRPVAAGILAIGGAIVEGSVGVDGRPGATEPMRGSLRRGAKIEGRGAPSSSRPVDDLGQWRDGTESPGRRGTDDRTGPRTTYAGPHLIHDADSHLMEPVDWLQSYADGATAAKLRTLDLAGGGGKATLDLVEQCWERRNDPVATAELAADVVNGPKGYFAYGSMDARERVGALDQLGFVSQFVFSTFAPSQFADADDLDLVYGGASAHTPGHARLHIDRPATGPRRLRAPPGSRAGGRLHDRGDRARHRGAVDSPRRAPRPQPHPPRLRRRCGPHCPRPACRWSLHLGANGTNRMARTWHNNGRDPGRDFVGGGENLRSKDFLNLHHDAENLLACMILDGIFEQFADLRCGVIEIGAGWVPNMLRSLDASIHAFGKHEPELAKLSLKPSEYVQRQISFTPWHFEDVGWLITSTSPELYLFSSDWPHPEGGRDPIGSFEASLDGAGIDPAARRLFYHDNMARLIG